MPAIINSDDGVVSGSSGLKTSGANDGITVFQQNGTESARITAAGNVGIGTSSPTQELHLYKDQNAATEILIENPNTGTSGRALLELSPELGSAYFTANSSTSTVSAIAGGALGAGLYTSSGLSNGLSVGTTAGALKFFAGSTSAERARFDSSGRLLVGTTSAPTQTGGVIVADDELFVYNIPTTASSANCHISSGESNRFYRSTSALKYKQDIRDIESIDINKFRPVRYKSKCENDDQTKDHFGVVADEVHAAGITELVSYGADGEIEGFQYERLTVVLLKAIQELKAELDATKAEVAALKARTT